MSTKEANSMTRSISQIRRGKATDDQRSAVYGESFVNLSIQSEEGQNSVLSMLQTRQEETGNEHGSKMLIDFSENGATLHFSSIIQGTPENVSFSMSFSQGHYPTSGGNPLIGTVHSHNHNRGLSGQGLDEIIGVGDMSAVQSTGIPWYTVGPQKTHVGYLQNGRTTHSEIPTGTNLLKHALFLTK